MVLSMRPAAHEVQLLAAPVVQVTQFEEHIVQLLFEATKKAPGQQVLQLLAELLAPQVRQVDEQGWQ